MGEEYYSNSRQHLMAELGRVELMIRARVRQAGKVHSPGNPFAGLCISEEEVEALLAQPSGFPSWAGFFQGGSIPELQPALERLTAEIEHRKAGSRQKRISLRFDELSTLFHLTPLEADTILVGLAPELDLRYERLYAYLQDDVSQKKPRVDLVLNLLCSSWEEKISAREFFGPRAPLRRNRLIRLEEEGPHPPLLAKHLRVEEGTVNFLLGSDELPESLLPYARFLEPSTRLEDLVLPPDFKERLTLLAHSAGKDPLILYFQGPYGAGKKAMAKGLCREMGVGLVFVDGQHLGEAAEDVYESLVMLADREARLRQAALYWEGFDSLLGEDRGVRRRVLLERLGEREGLTFLSGRETWEPAGGPALPPFLRVEFLPPDRSQRRQIWERSLEEEASLSRGPGLRALADKFRLTGGQIRDSVATARSRVRWRNPGGGSLSMDDLETACRLQSAPRLAGLARKIEPRVGWADILLPPDQKSQLRDICRQERYRSVVYGEWGFERKLSSGRGLSILFSGPPGTGKTMAAEVIAQELNLDLFKIDLAQVVSKYIGETEKNLSRIFQEAEAGHVLLFFDEAEALFGKRSEVKDAHDRYANIELGYLLQRMEEYEGIVILATNLRKNMDDAFIRRMQIVVEFPFPEEDLRRQIWAKIFPEETPLAEDLDLSLLAREVRLAGGNIRNIALRAAFYAAEDGGRVLLSHLREATQREYQKLGRTWDEKKFPAGEEGALADGEGHPEPSLRSTQRDSFKS